MWDPTIKLGPIDFAVFDVFQLQTNKQSIVFTILFSQIYKIIRKTKSLKLLKTKLPLTFPGVMWGTTQNFVPICSAVLTNIRDGQTIKQKDKQSIFIEEG